MPKAPTDSACISTLKSAERNRKGPWIIFNRLRQSNSSRYRSLRNQQQKNNQSSDLSHPPSPLLSLCLRVSVFQKNHRPSSLPCADFGNTESQRSRRDSLNVTNKNPPSGDGWLPPLTSLCLCVSVFQKTHRPSSFPHQYPSKNPIQRLSCAPPPDSSSRYAMSR